MKLQRAHLWLAAGLLLVLGGGGFYWFRHGRQSTTTYKELRVVKKDLAVHLLSTGTVAPENKLSIQAPVAGRVEKVLVEQGAVVKKGQVLAWVSSTERASILDGARSEGPAEVKKWEEIFKPTAVIAPVSGMLIQRNIQPGQTFTTTDAILVMSDHLIIQAQVDETDIGQVTLKQRASITLDAYPTDDHVILGQVKQIWFDAKTTNNVTTYQVDIKPDKVPTFMRSGMTANVNFEAAAKPGALVIAADAVHSQDGHPFVLIPAAESGKDPVRQDVVLGLTEGGEVEVVSGLSENQVVLQPEFKLNKGSEGGANPFMPQMKRKR